MKALKRADVEIAALQIGNGRVPCVVSEDMVQEMKKGAVVVDVSIDQGGCFETSEVTSHKNPVFTKHDIVHYCVPNIASRVSRTASMAISNIVTPILVGESVGIHPLIVMISLLIGGTLIGPIGMLLAVPAAGILKVIGVEIMFLRRNAHLL